MEDNEKENLEKDKNPDKEKKTLSKKQAESISTKQEIKTEQKVTDKDTMASLLNVQGKGYRKIAIVYSDKFKEAGNTTKFSFVGIKQDGSAEKIDTIEQAYGTNPTKNVHSVNRDGSKIEEKTETSFFKIEGKTETQIAVYIGNMGTIEPSLVRTPAQDNEEAISIPIETSNIRPTTREIRELMNRNRNTRVKEEIQEIEKHKKSGCKDFSIKDIDDNLDLLRGACALPIASAVVDYQDEKYLDGGITTMIPIERSIEQGCTKHLVITTKPEGYVRKPASKIVLFLMRIFYRKYPCIRKDYKVRHINYYKQMDLIDNLVKEKDAIMVRPSRTINISRFKGDPKDLDELYHLGYQDMEEKREEIYSFLSLNK